jgi:2'-5' RNA ligase|tara:strand:- start:102 stop:626 length:525 start_codon:yes stop_codon:yes gene_type:complete
MRLFIAIDFNELKDYFIGLQKSLPGNSKLSLTKTFHLTLKFLGEVPLGDIDKIKNQLKKVDFEKFSLNLDSVGVFPDGKFIRVVWVGLKPENEILELQRAIDEKLSDLFQIENNFKAHITLTRVKFIQDKNDFIDKLKKIKIDDKKVEIEEFKLIKSTLTPEGPVYETVALFKA